MTISPSTIEAYKNYLVSKNRASAAITEHLRYANRFAAFIGCEKLCVELLLEYRRYIDEKYTTYNSKNACISYANSFLRFLNETELLLAYFERKRGSAKIKTPALTEEDITKLLHYEEITPVISAWHKGRRLKKLTDDYRKTSLVIRLIIATGIRTSELPDVTVKAVSQGYIEVKYRANMRKVVLSDGIRNRLLLFAKDQGITSGSLFLTSNGLPCERNAVFRAFGRLATLVDIAPKRLTSDALRKYYNDKRLKENISTVQTSLGYKTINYFVEYDPPKTEILAKNLDALLAL